MNSSVRFIKKFANRLGIEISRYNVYSSSSLQLEKLLIYHNIGTVFDVGANAGQYALELRTNGFKGRIYSFEPQSEAYSKLKKTSSDDPKWFVAERMAVGNDDGEIEINISENSQSSSVLPILESHVSAAPDSAYIGKEIASIKKLDSIVREIEVEGNLFIKIDVQGFELNVLEGAKKLLQNTQGLHLELSLVNLYEGQMFMDDMVRYVGKLGFELHALSPCFIDPFSGRLLQLDGVFFKR